MPSVDMALLTRTAFTVGAGGNESVCWSVRVSAGEQGLGAKSAPGPRIGPQIFL